MFCSLNIRFNSSELNRLHLPVVVQTDVHNVVVDHTVAVKVEDAHDPGNDGQDAGDDPRPAEEGDGRGDSHLAAEAVALQSDLVQHLEVVLQWSYII